MLENLNGSAVFSKLYLCLGFHQIELDEDSRKVVSDINGVQNIGDDLIVHGKNNEEHDRNLNCVAAVGGEESHPQPSEVSIQDGQGSLQGTSSVKVRYRSNRRVRAVLESSRPAKQTEVRSFLRMVGFSTRFIPNFATIAEPLRAISRQGVPFVSGSEQEASFQEVKQQLAVRLFWHTSTKRHILE